MTEPVLRVERLGKKFCRSLKRSLWYGLKDLAAELLLRSAERTQLRPQEFWALSDISFDLQPGEMLGVVGHNGAGKTTLLKLINRLMRPDTGRIVVRGQIGALVALGTGFNPILSGRENIYVNAAVLGLRRAEVDRRLDEIIDFAELGEFIDAPVQNYSSGMKVRLGFAVASSLEPALLLIDEILAVGDASFRHRCLRRLDELRARGTSILLVSHNSFVMEDVCDRVLLLDHGRTTGLGDPQEMVARYLALAEELARQEHARKRGAAAPPPEEDEPVRITGFSCHDAAGAMVGSVRHGETIDLRLTFLATGQGLSDPHFEVMLRKGLADAPFCAYLSTMHDGCSPATAPVEGVVSLRLAAPPLTPGTYQVHAGVRALVSEALGNKWYARPRELGSFVVMPDGLGARFPGVPATYIVSNLPPLVLDHVWSLNGEALATRAAPTQVVAQAAPAPNSAAVG